MIFDTHAHYDDQAFDEDRESLLAGLGAAGIGAVTNVAASLESCRTTLALAGQYPWMYAALGVHPSESGALTEEDLQWLEGLCRDEALRGKVRAVGEIGLDYHWEEPEHEVQKKWFSQQLQLARRTKLPVVIHSRDAAKDTLDLMKAERAGEIGGVIHCFSYGKEMAREYLNMGFFLGIGGVLTFQNGRRLKEVVEYAPLSSLVLETDSPYLAPAPNRGKRNCSENLIYVAEALAQVKGMGAEEVQQITWDNALRLYRLA